jgi:hypothetical protein
LTISQEISDETARTPLKRAVLKNGGEIMQPQENSPEAQALKEMNRKPQATKTPLSQDEIDAKAQALLEIAKTETDGKLDPAKVKIWAQNTEKDATHRNGKVILGVRPDKKFLHYTELAITMNNDKIKTKITAFLDAYARLTAPAPAEAPAQ